VNFSYAAYVFDNVLVLSPPSTGLTGFLNALWMTIVTMTTIGYGDLTPHTYGGRVVMTFTSLISLVLFGLIVNQVCSTLEPGRIEKRLANMIEMRAARCDVRDLAASLIQKSAKLWLQRHRRNFSDVEEVYMQYEVVAYSRRLRQARMRHKSFKTIDDDIAVVCCEILASQEELRSQVINGQVKNAKAASNEREVEFGEVKTIMAAQDTMLQSMGRLIAHQGDMLDAIARGKTPPPPLAPDKLKVPKLHSIPSESTARQRTPRATEALINSGLEVADRPKADDTPEPQSSPPRGAGKR